MSHGVRMSVGVANWWWLVATAAAVSLLVIGSAAGGPGEQTSSAPASAPAIEPSQPNGHFVELKRLQPLPELPAKIEKAFVIPIQGAIDIATVKAIERKVISLKSQGAQIVIFEFDTPGGRVDAAERIAEIIQKELRDIRTVAFINTDAISAGAWLALCCNQIVMAPGSNFGDSAPISMQGEIKGITREKIETYLRSHFRNAAEANGYPTALVEAMVSIDVEVWLIQHVDTGEKRYVKRSEWSGRVQIPPGVTSAPSSTSAKWKVLRVVLPAGKLLTLTTSEADRYGFVHKVVSTMDELRQEYGITVAPTVLGDTWSEKLVSFLTSPAATGLLLLLAMFFGYIEINTPGFGFGGTIALICLAIMFGSRYLTGLAQWWEIAAFVVGVILLIAEILVTPGFGVLGVLGGLLCMVGLLASLVGNAPNMPPLPSPGLVMDTFLSGLFALMLGFLGGCIMCVVAARYLPKVPVASRLVLEDVSVADSVPYTSDSAIRHINVGDTGIVEVTCRPAGRVRFDDELVDVMTEGEFIEAGARVEVTRNEGNRLVVRPQVQA